ncbi:MAG: ferrous iron transport protein B [Oscillospiraceae bacterium]|nr:ferrous iron transport protein B [Oscillospiraceae bacterium]
MKKEIKIALAGNPNCGKTTLFNALTGSAQFVGNWPGVTVEKKEGKLKKHDGVTVVDLPGIYSLSPYTLEEVVARNYLIVERPDAILNIIDGTNLERNLYLTTQLTELGIPVVVAINMIDVVRKSGDVINVTELSRQLGCKVVEISALKGDGVALAAEAAVEAAESARTVPMHTFSGAVEHALAHIEEVTVHNMPEEQQRWYAIKLFERDEKVMESLKLDADTLKHIEQDITAAETECDDDAESIITNERYLYIASLIKSCCKKKNAGLLSASDKIDKVVTNRFAALPIFAVVMFLVYWIAMGPFGSMLTDWTNDVFGAEILQGNAASLMESWGAADWLSGLVVDGIIGGVGAVLGFVPQLLVLFLMLCILEDVGYMARVAFIMDRIFRKFGLSGKSFIPMLVGTGCGVPGVMASRTIENERDRRMTIMTTCFIPCGAKMPIVGMFAGALFGGSGLVAVSAYFIGVAAIIISGIMLKKTRPFTGEPAPFVMELPAYHVPAVGNVLRGTWERGWSFIKKAGTIILLSAIVLWFLQGFGFAEGKFGMVEDNNSSLLAAIGGAIAFIFAPLGFGDWQSTVATVTGLIAKENVVTTFGVLFHVAGEVAEDTPALLTAVAAHYSAISAYSFMIFNLLCAPCFAAMGAIRREMNNAKWTWAAIGYMCVFAYAVSLIVYQFGAWFIGAGSVIGTACAAIVLAFIVYMLLRPYKESEALKAAAACAN